MKERKCECGGNLKIDRDELVCELCGLVYDQVLDYGMGDKKLGSFIDGKGDEDWENVTWGEKSKLKRLQSIQQKVTDGVTKIEVDEITKTASEMGLPKDVKETAMAIYKKAKNKKLTIGRKNSVVAASLYAACRQHNVPRTLNEIANFSSSDYKRIGRAYKIMAKELKLKLMPPRPQDYVDRFCSELLSSHNTRLKSLEILDDERISSICERSAINAAVASIYIASILCEEHKSQNDIADVTGVCTATLAQYYREIAKILNLSNGLENWLYKNYGI